MMILSQDGMVAVNSDNVVMFEVKESETLPHETQLCATILITNGARFHRLIGTFKGPDRTELAKLALDYAEADAALTVDNIRIEELDQQAGHSRRQMEEIETAEAKLETLRRQATEQGQLAAG